MATLLGDACAAELSKAASVDEAVPAQAFLRLPFLSELSGIGGRIKARPSYFRVVEVADERTDHVSVEEAVWRYGKSDGKHVFVTLTREGMTTRDFVGAIARAFSIPADQIGVAGLKDRCAVCTQTFSLPRDVLPAELRAADALEAIGARCVAEGFTLEGEARWHQLKLRTGQLRGNRFEIVVSETDLPCADALAQARLIADALRLSGWANFYGPQRFGKGGPQLAVARSRKLLAERSGGQRNRRPHAKWLDTLHLNAFQSALFNEYLASRINAGMFGTLLVGDLVSPPETDGKPRTVLANEDASVPAEDLASFAAGEISFAGPLFGAGMRKTWGAAEQLEALVWHEHMPNMSLSSIKPTVLSGGRRVGRMPLPADFEIDEYPSACGLIFRFTLPRGAYATCLLREFIGREIYCQEEEDEGEQVSLIPACQADGGQVKDSPGATWTKEGTVGMRISCESQRDERKAFAQCIEMLGALRSLNPDLPALDGGGAYSIARTGAKGLLLLRSATATLDEPVSLAVQALEQALSTGVSPAPLVVRLLPVQLCCPATIDAILAALESILRPLGTAEDERDSYVAVINQRGSVSVDRQALIAAVGDLVERVSPHAQPDLETAHTAITIDVFDGTACLAILPHWHRLHSYNLRKAAAAASSAEPRP